MPLHRALVEELEENGYLSSASFLQQLIDFHEALRNEHGPDTPVWCRPRLIEQKEVLIELAETFKIAEAAHFDSILLISYQIRFLNFKSYFSFLLNIIHWISLFQTT